VFVTSEEFEHMKKLMNDIVSTSYNDATDTRKNLENIYIETIKQYLGASESDKMIKNMKLDEIMQYVTGIPTRSVLFKKYRLKDIESKLTSADLKEMISIIRDKKEKLRSIESDSNYRRFDMDKRTFYWIPDDYLP
jgi:hypothetical protein